MNLRHHLATVIKSIRKFRGKTQEDFSIVSSRTYLSTLERGLKSPTLDKLEELAGVLEVHPASLVILAYCLNSSNGGYNQQIERIADEARMLLPTCLIAADFQQPGVPS